MNITIEDFKDYVAGWLFIKEGDPDMRNLDLNNMKAALANALSQIECDQDGVEARTKWAQQKNKTK
jgi:hypothetical protein